jgi:hypothetical protein
MAPNGLHAAPVQYDALPWHIVPLGQGAALSTSHRWAHVPPAMHTAPEPQGAASMPHVWALIEHANPPARNAIAAIASSRLIGGSYRRYVAAEVRQIKPTIACLRDAHRAAGDRRVRGWRATVARSRTVSPRQLP